MMAKIEARFSTELGRGFVLAEGDLVRVISDDCYGRAVLRLKPDQVQDLISALRIVAGEAEVADEAPKAAGDRSAAMREAWARRKAKEALNGA